MKITVVLLFVSCMHVSATGLSQTITWSGKSVPLGEVLSVIKKQTGLLVFANQKQVAKAKPVTIDAHQMPLQEFMRRILDNQTLTFTIEGNTISVKERDLAPGLGARLELDVPPITIRGRVVNELGEPVAGASVMVKETSQGTTSDADGNFVLNNVDANATLVITGSNIERIDWKVNGRNDVSVMVKKAVNPLDEVVFKGYYKESKRFSTGNVSKIDASTIEKQPVSNPLQALQAQVAGLQIIQNTGVPGGAFSIRLRGRNSLRNEVGVNDPLVLIDGIPFLSTSFLSNATSGSIINQGSALNYINPADIDRIEVLKDADATAIYGSRGANGVILITTKRGRSGKTKVDLTFYSGAGKLTRTMEMLNTPQYLHMRNEAFINDQVTPIAANARDLLLWDTTRYTDWQKLLIGGTSNINNIQVSLHGGTGKTNFFAGGGVYKETTVFPGDFNSRKASGHLNINHTSENNNLSATFSVSFLNNLNNLLNNDLTTIALTLAPNAPKTHNEDGNLNWENGTWGNPMAILARKYKSNSNNLNISAELSYEVFKGFKIKTNLGYINTQVKELSTIPIASYDPATSGNTGSAIHSNNRFVSWIVEPQVSYQTSINSSKIEMLVGATLQQEDQEIETISASGYTSDILIGNLRAAQDISINDMIDREYHYAAFFARLGYNLKDKYLINLTARRDGSSRFGTGNQFANFGAIGTAWIFSEENFFKKLLPVISFGKIRLSYGITGSDKIGDYGYLSNYGVSSYPYIQSGLIPINLGNPDYSWESTKKLEYSLELGLIKDKIVLLTSFYLNKTSNQLVGYPLPLITGFSLINSNIPAKIVNKGLEFELTTKNITSKELIWKSNLTLTIPRNKLANYPNFENSTYANTYIVGQSLETRFKYGYIGVDRETGIYSFIDVDKNGTISSPDDLKTLQKIGQNYFAGVNNSIKFVNFEFDFLFQFVKQTGVSYLNSWAFAPGVLNGEFGNQPTLVMDRWQFTGDNSNIQKFTRSSSTPAGRAYFNSRINGQNTIVDASYIRLKNVSLSFTFPESIMRRLRLKTAKIYLIGQNLLTVTDYLGMDPENQAINRVPPLKVITAGIQLTF